jgi:hypothetical protein
MISGSNLKPNSSYIFCHKADRGMQVVIWWVNAERKPWNRVVLCTICSSYSLFVFFLKYIVCMCVCVMQRPLHFSSSLDEWYYVPEDRFLKTFACYYYCSDRGKPSGFQVHTQIDNTQACSSPASMFFLHQMDAKISCSSISFRHTTVFLRFLKG